MEKEQQSINYFKVIGKAILKIVLGLFLFLLFLFAVIFVAIRIPAVQTKVAQKAAAYLSDRIKHEVQIGRVDIAFFSKVVLEQVQVQDKQHNELFYIGRAEADISTFSIFHPNTLTIDELKLQQPRANLVIYEGSDTLNLKTFINAVGELFVKDTTKRPSEPFNFSLNELVLREGRFTYDNFNKPHDTLGLDYSHMTVANIFGRFNEIQLQDTIKVNVIDLSAVETRSNTRLHNLDTRMTYAPTYWEWDNLDLQLNQSNLQQFVRFDYNRFGNFNQFIDSVTVTANLQNSQVYSQDIALFASALRTYNERLHVNSIELKGKVKNFSAKNVDVIYGDNTHIVGSLNADGLPNFKETFANIRLKPSTINADDLKQFLPQNAYEMAERLGTIKFEGSFLGFYDDFVSNGSFVTALGNITSDINLKIDDRKRSSSYKGYLKTNRFNLGKLVNSDLVSTISMEGRIKGSGFTLEKANLELDATISQVQLADYNYRNIITDGTLKSQTYSGKITINDPNLKFIANGDVNFAAGKQAFNMVANLEKLDLQALKLSEQPFILRANANLDFKGLELDAFEGLARLDSALITYGKRSLAIDSVLIRSTIAEEQRSLSLSSELLSLNLAGNFDYTTLINDLKTLIKEYKLNFDSNNAATAAYYSRKPDRLKDEYSLTYNIHLKEANPLIQLYLPELTISDYTQIEGTFRHSNTVILNLYTELDTILYSDYKLYGNAIELNTSKLQQNPDVLAAALFTSKKQEITDATQTEDFYIEGIWSERTINFATSLRQPEQNNKATITGDLTFLQNQIQLVFDRSNVTLLESPWEFNPGNTVYISNGGKMIVFENFSILNQEQQIRIDGTVSEDPNSSLTLNINNFDMRNLNPLSNLKFRGALNAEVVARDIYNSALISSSLRVDSLYMDNILIGNINGHSNWISESQQLAVDIGIDRDSKKVLAVTGNYNPKAEEDQLDLLAVMEGTQLKLAEPLLRTIMSNFEGTMDGRIRVLGQLSSPVLKGSVMVNNGQFTFNYLNTTYRFSDRIYFGSNSISFRNAQLRDIYGNTATVTGGISHDGFRNMVLDINARYRNFMILNTTEDQNELFYGTAFATGSAEVLGPTNNLQINIDARSNENTRIVLPLDNQTEIARKDFIKFVNHTTGDTTGIAVKVEEDEVDLSGINLNFELDVTDAAYFELILDRTTGDMIRGSGNGDIRMTIDTRGDFHMYGNFEITNGAYNLNLLEGLVTREFQIRPGGTISWNGDPLAGTMNITATYTQMASISGLGVADDLSARIPVTAVVELNGAILTPQIRLGLNFDELPAQVEVAISGLINSIRNDENELNRQVFSLLVLRRLSPLGTVAFNEGAAGAVGGSLGSLLSGQLSSFLNSIDSNLEIDIGLDGLAQDDLSSLQVRLSYTFFQGRLRVTSETGFGGTASNATGSNTNTYQGDWSIEYYIAKSGELRARLEYNTIPRGFSTRVSNSQSISLLHTKRFDTFRELFGSNRRSRTREAERRRLILDSDPRLNL